MQTSDRDLIRVEVQTSARFLYQVHAVRRFSAVA
ncbi:hypothetical protein PhaeoP72_02758 [Phaeobacter inhibens]|nr:hypothetical protein PhaeoP92_02647 [Phaeobacter inhibens]AUQ79315.1 hypothetical protein PhaeoP74_02648 [Phaeobacter inhibens]AUR04707.1 hypothetical protein PhaeoP72_02758 [Phaeobacter inhibens]AUR16474.1 hypothetical protein PhaeoP70_02646 [Phaeobacter inhibens]